MKHFDINFVIKKHKDEIVHISDTHGYHHQLRNLPEADVVVHSGDFTINGSHWSPAKINA